jgi:hypothetical protein
LVIWPVEEIDARLSVVVSWPWPSSRQCRECSDGVKERPRRPSVLNPF